MLNFNPHLISGQLPLIHVIDNDDRLLLNSPDAHWYKILFHIQDKVYRFNLDYLRNMEILNVFIF